MSPDESLIYANGDLQQHGLDHSPNFQNISDTSAVSTADDYTFSSLLTDFDNNLAWPDAEQLLQTIVLSDWNSLTLPPEVSGSSLSNVASASNVAIDTGGQDGCDEAPQLDGSRMAIQSLSSMITNVVSEYRRPERGDLILIPCHSPVE
jgi:hypothetical protein